MQSAGWGRSLNTPAANPSSKSTRGSAGWRMPKPHRGLLEQFTGAGSHAPGPGTFLAIVGSVAERDSELPPCPGEAFLLRRVHFSSLSH